MSADEADRRNIDWGTDTCEVCGEESWLTMVLYEPVRALSQQAGGEQTAFAHHPAPRDEEPIPVCGQCLHESLAELADFYGAAETDVPFDQVWKYLIYKAKPEYAGRVFPDDAHSFGELSQG